MAVKTFGILSYNEQRNQWCIDKPEPHICIRLKQIFPKVGKSDTAPFYFSNTDENCHDLLWFIDRYPLAISDTDRAAMKRGSVSYVNLLNELERILMPEYAPRELKLNEGKAGRHYQVVGADFFNKVNRLLLADDLGLGKTVTAILTVLYEGAFPAIVVSPSHLTSHWHRQIQEFTGATIHVIKKTTPYSLPPADIYLSRYSCLQGWSDVAATGFWNTAIFDEIQDLRHTGTNKYTGGYVLSQNAKRVLALSATPIYNYGSEIWNIMNLVKPDSLNSYYEFVREWCGGGVWQSNRSVKVDDPAALGTYLREKHLMLRRARADVGMELPPINKLVYTVGYDEKEVDKHESRARMLAIQTTQGSFIERGEAAQELSIFVRKLTGVSKAKDVAAFVKILMEDGKPILLAGWHRDVYDIWLKELAEFNPVMYTGSESAKQKDDAVKEFVEGRSKIFIMSLRSGVGLDGLQHVCNTVVYGELDYSPKVHNQLTARVDRDGQQEQVTEIFLVSDWGSDPVIIDILGVKSSQSHGILNPGGELLEQYSNDTWVKQLAQKFIEKTAA